MDHHADRISELDYHANTINGHHANRVRETAFRIRMFNEVHKVVPSSS